MSVAIVVFPGSNCDRDGAHALRVTTGLTPRFHWHEEPLEPGRDDLVLLPGGFSWGDHLRCGAIAARSPAVRSLREHVERGGLVLGICNGFQILLEAGLLPGTMMINRGLRFLCRPVHLRVERTDTPFTTGLDAGRPVMFPIAHREGNYHAPPEVIDRLEGERRIAFRYCDAGGRVTEAANPNGSIHNIAGIFDGTGRVLGLMPHPERNAEQVLGTGDGRPFFQSIARWIRARPEGGRTA